MVFSRTSIIPKFPSQQNDESRSWVDVTCGQSGRQAILIPAFLYLQDAKCTQPGDSISVVSIEDVLRHRNFNMKT
jgi:hypothetical protein